MFRKVLIANRGEIAIRIIRACRELGVETVAVYSEADAEALHTRMADEAVCVGPPAPRESYNNQANVLSAAVITEADAVHPGYGFLAENAAFAEACAHAGLRFIGPSPESIQQMGDEAAARMLMKEHGVPILPGTEGAIRNEQQAVRAAGEVGFPLMVKAAAGGGGKGMRIVHEEAEFQNALNMAQAEAAAAFGNADVYLERYLEQSRHVEFQILADAAGEVIHLGERECSIQTARHQKMIEEAPCVALSPELREEMGQAAVRAARAANYENAGTVEFLLDGQGNYYFIEMNTRIQVEHPVTEWITGVDLIKAQIRIAAGEPLGLTQDDIQPRGHCIEARVTAEDPENDFAPSAGQVTELELPGGFGVRVDTLLFPSYTVPSYYDSLLCKITAWGADRDAAIQRMQRCLSELRVGGIPTNAAFLRKILASEAFQKAELSTNFLQRGMNGS